MEIQRPGSRCIRHACRQAGRQQAASPPSGSRNWAALNRQPTWMSSYWSSNTVYQLRPPSLKGTSWGPPSASAAVCSSGVGRQAAVYRGVGAGAVRPAMVGRAAGQQDRQQGGSSHWQQMQADEQARACAHGDDTGMQSTLAMRVTNQEWQRQTQGREQGQGEEAGVLLRHWEPAQEQQPLPQGWEREPGATGVRWTQPAPRRRRRLQWGRAAGHDGGMGWLLVPMLARRVPPPRHRRQAAGHHQLAPPHEHGMLRGAGRDWQPCTPTGPSQPTCVQGSE